MSVEIKNVYGKTLYVAEDAKNVREAVIAARNARADLARADLAGAYLAARNARADLAGADLAGAYLAGADLARADLARADLAGAYLTGADLAGAYLAGAYLAGADLTGADLTGADLTGADLAGAKGFNPLRANELLMLKDQPGKIRAYKLVTAKGFGPFNGGVEYKIGGKVEVTSANTDDNVQCAAGINVATMPWVLKNWRPGYRVLVVEFTAKDIAAIPVGDGKFRLHRCKVVGEKTLDELGLA